MHKLFLNNKETFFSISTGPGEHWFTILRTSVHAIEVFDSLGTSASFIKQWIPYKSVYEYNSFALQCPDSYLCGNFVIFYLVERFHNLDLDFEEFINDLFSTNCVENQKKVAKFFKEFGIFLKKNQDDIRPY